MVPSPSLAWLCACECATEVWNSGRKWSQVPGGPLQALSMWVKHQCEDMVKHGHEWIPAAVLSECGRADK